jgi:hypothetical protein
MPLQVIIAVLAFILAFAGGCVAGYTYALYYSKKAQSLKAHVSAEISTLRTDIANLLKRFGM